MIVSQGLPVTQFDKHIVTVIYGKIKSERNDGINYFSGLQTKIKCSSKPRIVTRRPEHICLPFGCGC